MLTSPPIATNNNNNNNSNNNNNKAVVIYVYLAPSMWLYLEIKNISS